MLHQKILKTETFQLLKELMSDENLQGFNLVGGTALALYLGHRQSIDLDLFCEKEFDVAALRKHLVEKYNFKERYTEKQTLKGEINGIFIDCIRYDYPQISTVNTLNNIRITSIPDLLAMKIAAITDTIIIIDIRAFTTKCQLESVPFVNSKNVPISINAKIIAII